MKRQAFLKPVAEGDDHLPDSWLEPRLGLLTEVGFARRPASVKRADHLIYYAPGPKETHQRMIGVVRATQDGAELAASNGFDKPYRLRVQALFVIPLLRFAPHYSASGVKAGELMKADIVLLLPEEYSRAISALTERVQPPGA
jgi:hypothetical protein